MVCLFQYQCCLFLSLLYDNIAILDPKTLWSNPGGLTLGDIKGNSDQGQEFGIKHAQPNSKNPVLCRTLVKYT